VALAAADVGVAGLYAGIAFSGVGNLYSHNTIYDAPHQAFTGGCNDCIFEFNNVSHMGYETADAGAWYALFCSHHACLHASAAV